MTAIVSALLVACAGPSDPQPAPVAVRLRIRAICDEYPATSCQADVTSPVAPSS